MPDTETGGWEYQLKEPGELRTDICPVPECGNTEDLWFMGCVPNYTWTFVNGCGHWGFIWVDPTNVPRETSTD